MYALGLVSVFFFLCGPAWGQSVSSDELLKNSGRYEGKRVTYEGEVIGDIMRRGRYAWLNVRDQARAIGIWAEVSLLTQIAFTGHYKSRGDIISVTGIFHNSCLEHGGDLDIHAQTIRILSRGKEIPEVVSPKKKKLSLMLLGAIILLWTLTHLLHK